MPGLDNQSEHKHADGTFHSNLFSREETRYMLGKCSTTQPHLTPSYLLNTVCSRVHALFRTTPEFAAPCPSSPAKQVECPVSQG